MNESSNALSNKIYMKEKKKRETKEKLGLIIRAVNNNLNGLLNFTTNLQLIQQLCVKVLT